MEKNTPHYRLTVVQTVVADPNSEPFTNLAKMGAIELGVNDKQMRAIVLALTRRSFYKSMTSFADHKVWQDVYTGTTDTGIEVYIKITQLPGLPPIIQFKRK